MWLRKCINPHFTSIKNIKFFSSTINQEESFKTKIKNGPGLKEFLIASKNLPALQNLKPTTELLHDNIPYLNPSYLYGNNRKVHFEVYGCQMNVNDTEIVWSILKKSGYGKCDDVKDADVILVVTCAIREGAETKIWNRLKHLSAMKKNRSKKNTPLQIGILGCMAERLKVNLIEREKYVDIVAGPDSYKDLPRLLALTKNSKQSAVNVLLSLDETYADVVPVRLNEGSATAFLSIMRGCDNMCSYCIVPFTRGKERSREISSILNEVQLLEKQNIKEITLLGQNVNSYRDINDDPNRIVTTKLAKGFQTVYKDKKGGLRFSELLERVASSVPNIRIRFTSPHPKDFPDDVLEVIKYYPNICKNIHLPAQSGSSSVLNRMRRGYTREAYIELVERIRSYLPDVSLSSDFICGFCGETDSEFEDTITLIEQVKYNAAYLFSYSMRAKTTAQRRFIDDISIDVKKNRLQRMMTSFRSGANELQAKFVNKTELVLIEGESKRSSEAVYGRNDANIKVILPKRFVNGKQINIGDFIATKINYSNSQILKGDPLYHCSVVEFYKK